MGFYGCKVILGERIVFSFLVRYCVNENEVFEGVAGGLLNKYV